VCAATLRSPSSFLACCCLLQEVIRQLEPHPFVTAYLEWAGLNTMLTKYYNDAYIGAAQGPDPQTSRWAVYDRVHTIQRMMCRCELHALLPGCQQHNAAVRIGQP
jgi:hypothetical protein